MKKQWYIGIEKVVSRREKEETNEEDALISRMSTIEQFQKLQEITLGNNSEMVVFLFESVSLCQLLHGEIATMIQKSSFHATNYEYNIGQLGGYGNYLFLKFSNYKPACLTDLNEIRDTFFLFLSNWLSQSLHYFFTFLNTHKNKQIIIYLFNSHYFHF